MSWYDPALHHANFVILDPRAESYRVDGTYAMVQATFGKPAHVYQVSSYLVLVWNKNLLAGLGCGKIYSRPTGTATPEGPRCSPRTGGTRGS